MTPYRPTLPPGFPAGVSEEKGAPVTGDEYDAALRVVLGLGDEADGELVCRRTVSGTPEQSARVILRLAAEHGYHRECIP